MDQLICAFDRALKTLTGVSSTVRPLPGEELPECIADDRRAEVVALMRVNHSGEVCAQALYQGQALLARDARVAAALQASADEETEHLAWTALRVAQLGGRTSLLDPIWYVGAFVIGAGAAAFGDRVSLGFLQETEHQVVDHLSRHLARIPETDMRTRAILEQMTLDEAKHAALAQQLGATVLPWPLPTLMRTSSRVMTRLAYYV